MSRAAEVFPGNSAVKRATQREPEAAVSAVGEWVGWRSELALAALHSLSQRMPLLLVLEDVHRASTTLLDLLTEIVALAARAQIVLLLTLRTDAPPAPTTETGLSRLLGLQTLGRVDLAPLGTEDLRALAEEAYPGLELPDALARDFAARSGGNPFFARAILRLLVEREALVRDGMDWRLEAVDELPAAELAFADAPGTVRMPDPMTIHLRLPQGYLEPDTLIPILRRMFMNANAKVEATT